VARVGINKPGEVVWPKPQVNNIIKVLGGLMACLLNVNGPKRGYKYQLTTAWVYTTPPLTPLIAHRVGGMGCFSRARLAFLARVLLKVNKFCVSPMFLACVF